MCQNLKIMIKDRFGDCESFGYQYEFIPDKYSNFDISSYVCPKNSLNNGKNKINDDLNEPYDDSHCFINKNENNIKSNNELTAPISYHSVKNSDIKEQNKNINNVEINKEENDVIEKKKGRKAKDDNRKVEHTRDKPDNMMRKIKTYFMNFLNEYLNKSLKFTYRRFLKITTEVNENLKTDFNIDLMKMTIKEIYEKFPLNKRYNPGKNPNYILIKQIYENGDEKEALRILNSKYIDILDEFRNNYLKKFNMDLLKKLKIKELTEKDKKYFEKLNDLLFQYEEWFELKNQKKPRKSH